MPHACQPHALKTSNLFTSAPIRTNTASEGNGRLKMFVEKGVGEHHSNTFIGGLMFTSCEEDRGRKACKKINAED